ncbi:MAG: thiol:disulfide interchange protein DsbD [Candidatus Nitrotoga sp. SPKER]|nr:MAG: thiol:disulfide interchange protein DsbD [Candidatus Nitrotoga sp. SPKER]
MRFLLLILLCLIPLSHADSFLDRLPLLGGAKQSVILHPDKAFGLEVNVRDASTLLTNFKITPGYYLYRDKVTFTISGDSAKTAGVKITNVSMPKGEMKSDPNFGDMTVFHQSFQAVITLDRNTDTAQEITLAASYQGCKENDLCYAPIDKQFNILLPKASLATTITSQMQVSPQSAQGLAMPADSESTQLAKLFKQGSFWLIVSFFFGAGLLLAFTPCVLPMIPILSGIIVGRSSHPTKMHGFLLSLAYVLGMALTYAAIGVAAGLSGTLLSSALQTPWALGSFAAVFVLLSLSMFGFYELQLPAALQSKLTNTSNQLHGGHLSGVFVMGALSAVIVSPCVAAPMAAALLYIGQTHDAWLGGTALFALAMGMGLPLLLIGASAGALLPKAGVWMEAVKHFFGVVMLALAIWLISPLIPLSIQMLLWAALLVLSAIYMHALDALPNNASGWQKLWKGIGILALLLGSAYLIGALSGARDILRPLAALGNGQAAAASTLQFMRVKNVAELDARIAQAKGKTVMLDFYADWCISCKEMERYTFTDAQVQAKLKKIVLLQVDVTANNNEDKSVLKRFELFGPPAILFFDAQGHEQDVRRVIGYQNAGQFLQSLNYVGL